MMMKPLIDKIYNLPKWLFAAYSLALVFLVGACDYLTGYEISFSIFYLLPVMLVSWFAARGPALMFSLLSAAVWCVADITSGHPYSYYAIPLWNAAVRLGFFLVVVFAVAVIKDMLEREKNMSRIDLLTGISNHRHLFEMMANEMNRTVRFGHPFSLAYINIDDFKQVNDTLGHSAGDRLLREVATAIRTNIRLIDTVARLGGDEFAVLMPSTGGPNAVTGMNKVKTHLDDMASNNSWSITFSIGVVTCYEACDLDAILKEADDLMSSLKARGKNMIESVVHKQYNSNP